MSAENDWSLLAVLCLSVVVVVLLIVAPFGVLAFVTWLARQ